MKLDVIISRMEFDILSQRDNATYFRADDSMPMSYYFDGVADGMTLALRYLEQLDKKETAAPASTAANPL